MTKRQLNAQRRAAKRPAPRQRRFRGWPWENEPRVRPGEVLAIGRCMSRQGIPIFFKYSHRPVRSTSDPLQPCPHCGRPVEFVGRA